MAPFVVLYVGRNLSHVFQNGWCRNSKSDKNLVDDFLLTQHEGESDMLDQSVPEFNAQTTQRLSLSVSDKKGPQRCHIINCA